MRRSSNRFVFVYLTRARACVENGFFCGARVRVCVEAGIYAFETQSWLRQAKTKKQRRVGQETEDG